MGVKVGVAQIKYVWSAREAAEQFSKASPKLLLAAEALLGLTLFGRTAAEQWAALNSPAGLLGLSAQLAAALFPLVFRYTERS